jgi:hypothetical protein
MTILRAGLCARYSATSVALFSRPPLFRPADQRPNCRRATVPVLLFLVQRRCDRCSLQPRRMQRQNPRVAFDEILIPCMGPPSLRTAQRAKRLASPTGGGEWLLTRLAAPLSGRMRAQPAVPAAVLAPLLARQQLHALVALGAVSDFTGLAERGKKAGSVTKSPESAGEACRRDLAHRAASRAGVLDELSARAASPPIAARRTVVVGPPNLARRASNRRLTDRAPMQAWAAAARRAAGRRTRLVPALLERIDTALWAKRTDDLGRLPRAVALSRTEPTLPSCDKAGGRRKHRPTHFAGARNRLRLRTDVAAEPLPSSGRLALTLRRDRLSAPRTLTESQSHCTPPATIVRQSVAVFSW